MRKVLIAGGIHGMGHHIAQTLAQRLHEPIVVVNASGGTDVIGKISPHGEETLGDYKTCCLGEIQFPEPLPMPSMLYRVAPLNYINGKKRKKFRKK